MAETKNRQITKKNDFVEIKFTGYLKGVPFDSNIEEDLKKIHPEAKPQETIVVIGQSMVVPGLDKDLEGKEINKFYSIHLLPKEGFGVRDRNLVKTIPLRVFTEKQINPYPGLVLNMDNTIAKVIAVSGARVVMDFNNPLAGKEIDYTYKITRIIDDENEKIKVLFNQLLKFIPDFEVNEKIIVKGQKQLELFVNSLKEKFKELIGKDLVFQEKDKKRDLEKTVSESNKGNKEEKVN